MMDPTIHTTKFGEKYSVRIEWKKEGYRLVESFDELVKLLRKELEETDAQRKA